MPIDVPTQNQPIPSGTNIPVLGTASDGDPDTRKPPTVDSVTFQVDGGAKNGALKYTQHHMGFITFASYHGQIGVLADGRHTITIGSDFSTGDTVSDSVTVNVGQPPIDAVLTGTCNIKSALAYSTPATVGLRFSPPSTVEVTSFPPIIRSTSVSGVTIKTTLSQASGGIGTFDSGDGSISIPIVFDVAAEVDVSYSLGTITLLSERATLALTLTTGPTISPLFNDHGSPLQPAPASKVILDGDGVYTDGQGNSMTILGMSDGAVSVVGTISPHP